MTPSESAAARRTAPARSPREARPGAAPPPPLRVVPTGRQRAPRRRLLALLPVVVVIGALLVVVVGQALLASGQVRLAGIQQKLNVAQGVHRQIELQVSQLETPSRIVHDALGAGMVHPTKVNQLPYVSLYTPLPTPAVTPVPAATTPTTAATTTPTTAATTTPTTTAGQ